MNCLLKTLSSICLDLKASDSPVLFLVFWHCYNNVLKSGFSRLPSICLSEQKLEEEIQGLTTSEKQTYFSKEKKNTLSGGILARLEEMVTLARLRV